MAHVETQFPLVTAGQGNQRLYSIRRALIHAGMQTNGHVTDEIVMSGRFETYGRS
jgi:hypothetical protein